MDIRTWLGYEDLRGQFSRVDNIVNEILEHYKNSIYTLLNEHELHNSISELEKEIGNYSKNVYSEQLISWLNDEGFLFLSKLGSYLYEDNEVVAEKLEYLEYILSTEILGLEKYPEDGISVIIDVSEQVEEIILIEAKVVKQLNKLHYRRNITKYIEDDYKNLFETFDYYIDGLKEPYDKLLLNGFYSENVLENSYSNCKDSFYGCTIYNVGE
ncbi:hypothetical protein CD30_16390 [Ureibacillus massiliensis 4400831 = CIP 108448 = CCUG 49529]|uniref:Uncharacterized protein n=1 Tax=Ureibacillus massiliensis 4400831 = CIP 108448 = CCUG 49529 TaxID=1211035 RepID=A0A0A3IXX6_9BACL|nr:hypothetical protein [Ureibacillus massiliensis]KGR89576.1 hypothetical protein CD30_16390 [Ureibacillus massiliensis 4400831 = CIP 108448 = CCUG 49529]